ncbi:MAG: hypothetical protein B7Z58_07695 [Acidiphilium sp. 37-64-53]|uniref:glycosyltransferase family 2 protein n=1 Tax=Acidiphilium TaxID=522 RepID=UPI000BCBE688|nr:MULTISPECIES: glycosyltransferase [Acidiphilium]OYW02470.1 MAG: hypothetical protein B7Z58_07695 [Acidiphilium sp. 37-64-53]OZB30257.1 MAG: hypothetical protein B7X49_03825 [Acidiphilium sp. 34-64-41]HQT84426.1 glycosyltransferase [Acidiphilium rubrum]
MPKNVERPAPAPAPAPATLNTPWGFIDEFSLSRIVGWAWNPADPTESLEIDLLDDDHHLLTITANLPRSDLRDAGVGDGNHGFALENIAFLFPKSRHLLRLRNARTKVELPGSPRLLIRHDSGFDDPAADFIDGVLTSLAAHATNTATIDNALTLLLARLNDLVNARFRLDTAPRTDTAEIVSRVRLTDWTHELVTNLLHTYQPIHIPPLSPTPLVSIIIPVHDKFAVTYNCIESIARHLPKTPIEIIIVDDGSRDETLFAALLFSGAIRIVRTPTNGGFIAACNYGAAAATGDFLFFLNNDTLVRDAWLDTLVETFTILPNIGIAGSRLFFADGTLQEVGGII